MHLNCKLFYQPLKRYYEFTVYKTVTHGESKKKIFFHGPMVVCAGIYCNWVYNTYVQHGLVVGGYILIPSHLTYSVSGMHDT